VSCYPDESTPLLRLQVVRPAAGSVLTSGRVSSGVGWLSCDTRVISLQVRIADQVPVTARLGVPPPHWKALTGQNLPASSGDTLLGFVFSINVPALLPGPSAMLFEIQTGAGVLHVEHSIEIRADQDKGPSLDPKPAAAAPILGATEEARVNERTMIKLLCEEACLSADGGFGVKGWAICAPEIEALTVTLDDVVVGNVMVDESRPDVGNRYPNIPSARRAGFRLVRSLGQPFTGEHVMQLTVIGTDGRRKSVSQILQTEPSLPPHFLKQLAALSPSPRQAQPGVEPIRFFLDAPTVRDGAAVDIVRGFLSLGGWAVATTKITRVEVFVDDVSMGRAHYGIRRDDVQTNLPGYNALLSGFAMVLTPQVMTPGIHQLRIAFEDEQGNVGETTFSVQADKVATGAGPWALRSKLPYSEIMLKTAILAANGDLPHWHIVIAYRNGRDVGPVTATIQSLRDQALPHWEATILTGPGQASLLAKGLAGVRADAGHRIRIIEASPSRMLAELNDHATFMAVLTPGDRLGEDALLEMSVEAVLQPQADFLYSDEQRIDPADATIKAFFKPDWSPDLLLSTNYIGQFWAARPRLVAAAGLLQGEILAGAEYDTVLRLSEQATAVHHVAKVLCATIRRATPRAPQRQALMRAMRRRGVNAQVQPWLIEGTWRISRPVAEHAMVSIIIPTIAARGLIETAIGSIRKHTRWPHYEIICLDNIPRNGTPDQLRCKAWIAANADRTIEISSRFNWSKFNNRGAKAALGDYLLFLNDDIEVLDSEWLHGLVEQAQRPEIGVVGPQLLYADGRVQHAGMFLAEKSARHAFRFYPRDEPGPFGLARTQRDVISVTGACMLMRRAVYDALGGFDESHAVINNDLDFNLRVHRAGYAVLFTPYVSLVHHEMASRAEIGDIFDSVSFQRAWGNTFLKGDPYFSPHLSLDSDDYLPDAEPVRQFTVGHPVVAKEAIRRILAIKVDHIGDFVTAFPALRRIKRHFPNAHLTVLAAKASLALVAMEPAIDRVIEFNFFHARSEKGERVMARKALRDLQDQLSRERFDLAIDLRRQPETRQILRHTGARWLAGFDRGYAHPWLDFSVEFEGDLANHLKHEHVVDSLVHLVDAIAANCDPDRDVLSARPTRSVARDGIAALLLANGLSPDRLGAPLACLHTGAGSVNKQWPGSSFAGLIDLLTGEANATVMLIGGPDESVAVAALLKLARYSGPIVNLVGKIPLRDLPGVITAADLYVGNDSGPKHIAAALGVPTVGIHSGTVDAGEWGPMGPHGITIRREMTCSPCYLARAADCHRGLACLTGLKVADIWQASRRMLALTPPRAVSADSSTKIEAATDLGE
jgi:ADP-heptose:LPS heptosyltransferase/GT2 family glycosyltransferase